MHDLELQTDPIARVLAVCLLLGLVWLVASPLLHTFHRPLYFLGLGEVLEVGEDLDGRRCDGQAGKVAQIQGLAMQAEAEGELGAMALARRQRQLHLVERGLVHPLVPAALL